MTREEILGRLTEIMRAVFDQPTLVPSEATTAGDVDGWDSLAHIGLIVAVEKEFGLHFSVKEVKTLSNVGDLVGLIARRVS